MTFKSHIINRYEHIVFSQMLRNGRNTDPNLEILKDKIKITPNLKGVNYNLNLKLNTWWAMAVCFDNNKKKSIVNSTKFYPIKIIWKEFTSKAPTHYMTIK